LIVVAGKVAIGATGAVGVKTGIGYTLTRTGVGLYTIAFNSAGGVPDILFVTADVVFATGNNTQEAFMLTQVKSTATATIQCVDSGTQDTAADPPSGSFIQVFAVIQNSSSVG
jgi:hypothetical protein